MSCDDETCDKFCRLAAIVRRLRGPGGCPWDQKQTPESFRTYLIEEVYELVEAMDQRDPAGVEEELGDLFFQLLFVHALFQDETLGKVSLAGALDAIIAKMIRRHPHVFGETEVEDEAALKRQWHTIKAGEKKRVRLMDIPRSLPALRRAQRVLDRAARAGLATPPVQQLREAMAQAVADLGTAPTAETLGRLFFLGAVLARRAGCNAEEALAAEVDRFTGRFTAEIPAGDNGERLPELDEARSAAFWQAILAAPRQNR